MSSNNNVQKDAEKAKQEAQGKFDKAAAEAKELERKGLDAAKRGEKRAEKAYDDASKQASEYWKVFSSEPKYWATTLGVVNAALIAGVGIFAYQNQDQVKSWDRRLVSAVSVSVAALLGGQTYLATQKAREQTGSK